MKHIQVQTRPRGYSVKIGAGMLARLGQHLRPLLSPESRVVVLTDENVERHWAGPLQGALERARIASERITIAAGESAKRLQTLEAIATQMVERGCDRNTVLLALGGGVVGDLGGLAASLYMRGIAVVQVPTTLLAQVDAAIGGKTGVNLTAGKNLLGTFHQPLAVFCDTDVLRTLPEREYRAGLFEALKYGVICNAKIFDFMCAKREKMLARDAKALEWLIAECVAVKAEVVRKDERDAGLRRILNFGHTVGHALEAETGYRGFLHGEAVGWGMVAASYIGHASGMTPASVAERIVQAVLAYAPLPPIEVSAESLLSRLAADKKSRNGVPHFVLPRAIGKVDIVSNIPQEAVLRAIEQTRTLSRRP